MSIVDQTALLGDLNAASFDRDFWAKAIIDSARSLGRDIPTDVDLSEAITSILPESHVVGASAMKVTIHDPGFELLRSGFFSPADNGAAPGMQKVELITRTRGGKKLRRTKQRLYGIPGTLDPIEVNYPEGTDYWWRLSIISPARQSENIALTFIDRIADEMMQLKGPYKANRDAQTRAEFLQAVAGHVPEIRFHSFQLDVKEPVDPVDISAPVPSKKTKKKKKTVGLAVNYSTLTVRGKQMGSRQAEQVNIILNQAHKDNAGEAATIAAIYAAIWESNLEKYAGPNSLGYWGVFSGSDKTWAQFDTAGMAHAFFVGGGGFHPDPGGAISLEQSGIKNPIEIAVKVEVPSNWPDNAYAKESDYLGDQQALLEATLIVQGGGGAAQPGATGPGTTIEVVQPYFFQIGISSNPNETDWDGSQRIAGEVNWRLFTDGPDMYYDSDMTLIKQKVSALIHIDDDNVIDWSYDWENRNIATAFTLYLVCGPFEFRAGEVFMLKGFGVDDGSTAKLPGRWLVTDAVRQANNLITQFTLKQPEPQKNEPAPEVVAVQTSSKAGAGTDTTLVTPLGNVKVETILKGESTLVPNHPELKSAVSQIVNLLLGRFPDLQITSTLRPQESGSYHAVGRACDLALPMTAAGTARMDLIGQWIADNLTSALVEGIHNPTLSVKDGKHVPASFWGSATWAQHLNHIHVAA